MEVTHLPYNKFLGLEIHGDGRLALPDDSRYRNHLGTVHAGALRSNTNGRDLGGSYHVANVLLMS